MGNERHLLFGNDAHGAADVVARHAVRPHQGRRTVQPEHAATVILVGTSRVDSEPIGRSTL